MQELMPTIRIFIVNLLIIIALLPNKAYAQSHLDTLSITSYEQLMQTDTLSNNIFDDAVARAERILKHITLRTDKVDFAIYPAASYSGQSGLAIGIMPLIRIKNQQSKHATIITPSTLVSTKKMWELQCDANIYIRQNNQIEAKLEFFHQPDNYYGICSVYGGNKQASYHIYRYLLNATYTRTLGEHFRVGAVADFTYHKFRNIEADTATIYAEIETSAGWSNGAGVVVGFDTRDSHTYTTEGWYAQAKWLCYDNALGGNKHFSTFMVDVRRYIPVGIASVVAMQAYWSSAVGGEAQFYKMSTFGGTRLGRAIPHCQKYVDHHAWLYQAEMRYPLFWRIGGTVWLGAGNVARKANKELVQSVHGMVGTGLRFKAFADKGLNIRIDGGLSTKGDKAIYINVREAF